MDLETLRYDVKKRLPLIPICSAMVGCNNQIIFSEVNQKIVLLQGYNRIKIFPLLHQNVLYFRNMKSRDQYLYATQSKDRFKAICKDGFEYVWCMQTGRLVNSGIKLFDISQLIKCRHRIPNADFEVYRSQSEITNGEIGIYNEGVMPYTLLCLKEEEKEYTDKMFYGNRMTSSLHQKNHL